MVLEETSCQSVTKPMRRCVAPKLLGLITLVALLELSCSRRIPLPKDASWDDTSAKFAWWGGEVSLPAGFKYHVDQGTDTFEGHFASADRTLVVRHDIGGYAGAYASKKRAFVF